VVQKIEQNKEPDSILSTREYLPYRDHDTRFRDPVILNEAHCSEWELCPKTEQSGLQQTLLQGDKTDKRVFANTLIFHSSENVVMAFGQDGSQPSSQLHG
jgi:hypothetical protein